MSILTIGSVLWWTGQLFLGLLLLSKLPCGWIVKRKIVDREAASARVLGPAQLNCCSLGIESGPEPPSVLPLDDSGSIHTLMVLVDHLQGCRWAWVVDW